MRIFMATDEEYMKDLAKKADESRDNTFDSWLTDLEEKEQPEACSIDNPDCENCGS
jgi:hypothetical protein